MTAHDSILVFLGVLFGLDIAGVFYIVVSEQALRRLARRIA